MSDIVLQHDVASLGALLALSAPAVATAGGTGDATATTGRTIDRFGFGGGGIANSAVFAIAWDATLSATYTLTLGYVVQHSADGTTWATYASGSSVVATGATGGSTTYGTLEIGLDLHSADRYVRINTTPDLSATATDTAATRSIGFFAGFDRLPQ